MSLAIDLSSGPGVEHKDARSANHNKQLLLGSRYTEQFKPSRSRTTGRTACCRTRRLLLLKLLRKRLQYTRIEFGRVWSGKSDFFNEEIGQNFDKLAVAALVQLWFVHEFCFIKILIRVLVGDGKLEMQG